MKVEVDEYMDIERRETVKAEARKLRRQFIGLMDMFLSIEKYLMLILKDSICRLRLRRQVWVKSQ